MDIIKDRYNKFIQLQTLSYRSINDFSTDFYEDNLINLFFDAIGIIGLITVIFSLIPWALHIYKNRKLFGLPLIFNFIRFLGFIMIFTYIYFKQKRRDIIFSSLITSIFVSIFLYIVSRKYPNY